MKRYKSLIPLLLVSVFTFFVIVPVNIAESGDDWKAELREVCSKVQIADELSIKELQDLIAQADELTIKISTSGDRRMKIFVMRLQKCKSFFEFTIETKEPKK